MSIELDALNNKIKKDDLVVFLNYTKHCKAVFVPAIVVGVELNMVYVKYKAENLHGEEQFVYERLLCNDVVVVNSKCRMILNVLGEYSCPAISDKNNQEISTRN